MFSPFHFLGGGFRSFADYKTSCYHTKGWKVNCMCWFEGSGFGRFILTLACHGGFANQIHLLNPKDNVSRQVGGSETCRSPKLARAALGFPSQRILLFSIAYPEEPNSHEFRGNLLRTAVFGTMLIWESGCISLPKFPGMFLSFRMAIVVVTQQHATFLSENLFGLPDGF